MITRTPAAVIRVLSHTAYPRSGNAHNPTRYYVWNVVVGARIIATMTTRLAAKQFAEEWNGRGGDIDITRDAEGFPYKQDPDLDTPVRLTKCCRAYPALNQDDGTPYCKACYEAVPWETLSDPAL